ncbi:MAG: anion transporter [Ignavibacterium album]|jgi:Na+/H+ antiporter NhaD/arsenite permease-like protein|uniref:anion transporter n=1 Tax=Ignavibacterium album TaxID=591197 RepID=UPI0026F1CC15|nr:anion transporter [Ignavibacterium album]MCX8104261.1 anion transporter [Ignavibacterium album]
MNETIYYLNLLTILLTLIGIAIGSYPGFRMNRATIALVGATILVIINNLSFEEAAKLVDINTIMLLFAMMVLNINLRLSGFFNIIANRIIRIAKTPQQLLALIIFSSGFLSALFLNDTIVIMFTPLLIEVVLKLKRNPIPYLIALATSANVGSVATIVGNPQNMIIGIFSGLSFIEFAINLFPVAIIGLLIIWMIIVIAYKKEFRDKAILESDEFHPRIFKPLLIKSSIVLVIMLIAFISGLPIALSALGASALLLITRRIKPERVFVELDWSLLVFFSGLFIVTDLLNQILITPNFKGSIEVITKNPLIDLSVISLILSNLISNVPAVLVLSPLIKQIENAEIFWLALAMSSTFAGNLTLLGSVANLIVAESAKRNGVVLSFTEYLKSGIPITILTFLVGVVWLLLTL